MQLPLSLNPPIILGQINDVWMTAWLTPIWFLAAGIALGLVLLAAFVLLFRLLSGVPGWNSLSESDGGVQGHAVAAGLTVLATAAIWFFKLRNLGDSALREPLLLGAGTFLVMAILFWSLVFCSNRRSAKVMFETLTEGVASYLGITAIVIVLIGAAVWGVGEARRDPIVEGPIAAFQSIPEVFATSEVKKEVTIPGAADESSPFVEVDIPVDFTLLTDFTLETDRTVTLGDAADPLEFLSAPTRLNAQESIEWNNNLALDSLPIPTDTKRKLHVQNNEVDDATLTFTIVTAPPVPEAISILIGAIVVVLIGLLVLLQQAIAPRASAVALATIKNELAQPLFLVLMAIGILLIVVYVFLPFNTFGEDIKLLKDCGITTIMLLAIFQGIWSASSSVSEEIEGRTALTVLCKPIQRRSFVIGKFLGVFWVLLLMFVVLGTIEMGAVAYKPLYDAKEASQQTPPWQLCHLEMMRTVPGLAMALMQAVVLTAISVALATRLPLLANLSVCLGIYVLGNLSTPLISSTQDAFPIVQFAAQLAATIIPILEHFSMQAAIDADNPITMSLLSGNLLYCLLYVLLAMFLALLLFEDRDLA